MNVLYIIEGNDHGITCMVRGVCGKHLNCFLGNIKCLYSIAKLYSTCTCTSICVIRCYSVLSNEERVLHKSTAVQQLISYVL